MWPLVCCTIKHNSVHYANPFCSPSKRSVNNLKQFYFWDFSPLSVKFCDIHTPKFRLSLCFHDEVLKVLVVMAFKKYKCDMEKKPWHKRNTSTKTYSYSYKLTTKLTDYFSQINNLCSPKISKSGQGSSHVSAVLRKPFLYGPQWKLAPLQLLVHLHLDWSMLDLKWPLSSPQAKSLQTKRKWHSLYKLF